MQVPPVGKPLGYDKASRDDISIQSTEILLFFKIEKSTVGPLLAYETDFIVGSVRLLENQRLIELSVRTPHTERMAGAILPKELIELQLGQIDLLIAMYQADDAVAIDETHTAILEKLRIWCESDESSPPTLTESTIYLLLSLDIAHSDGDFPAGPEPLQLEISVPLIDEREAPVEALIEPPDVGIRVRQPAWMSKAEAARLTESIPREDMLSAIDFVKDAAAEHLSTAMREANSKTNVTGSDGPIVRIWFYFPSISTRSKRDDIVNYAPTYGLTGFLLAGKPGVLCLEGDSQAIDDYMKFIKTESWGDIPSQHKKVSERFRETGADVERAFKDMSEITQTFGERRGERANRNDMKALENWLTQNGVGHAFTMVFM